MAPGAEALFGGDAGPDIKSLGAVSVELQLFPSLHLLPVLRQDEEGVCRHRVQCHILWGHQETNKVVGNYSSGCSTAPLNVESGSYMMMSFQVTCG